MSLEAVNNSVLDENSIKRKEGQKATILSVEDNSDLQDVIAEILRDYGYTVLKAQDANAALKILNSQTPDLILCDIMMPHKDGFQLFEEVKNISKLSQTPFVFLTALNSAENIRVGKEIGCDDYLVKPFDPDELISTVGGKILAASRRKKTEENKLTSFRKRIIHTLSHEFRTPLVSITTGTELLSDLKNQLNDLEVEKLISSIQKDGQRLERLVTDFMIIQQLDLGHAADATQRFRKKQNVIELIETAVELFEDAQVKNKLSAKINVNFSENVKSEIEIDVYDVQIIHAIQHLLSNAAKFSNTSKEIDVNVFVVGKKVYVQVRDYGPGLPKDLMNSACELFSQIDREKLEQQGTGIGLTIVQQFTQLNQGEFHLKKPQSGTGLIGELSFEIENS
ncbi:MAG: response regulator [Proteobacteria bacterium]|nr:response regulator [Pseudomonadota bacterium]